MTCAHCVGAGRLFGKRVADAERRRYRRRGLRRTTEELVDGLAGVGASGRTLLDVGGGIGTVQLALFERGLDRALSVDASPEYVAIAREMASEAGKDSFVERRLGDFVDLAPDVAGFDLVSLDRVLCCYPDPRRLLGASASRARCRLGLVWPLDRWWVRIGAGMANLYLRLRGNPFRVYVHPDEVVEAAVRGEGLARLTHVRRGPWQVAIYEREATLTSASILA